MTIVDFLGRELGYSGPEDELDALRRLAGATLATTRFHADLEACRASLEPWMPLHLLPIGESDGFHVGLHLRPADVAGHRLAIARMSPEVGIIEQARSVRQLAFLAVAGREAADADEPGSRYLARALGEAGRLLGADFYPAGGHGFRTLDDVEAYLIGAGEGTPLAFDKAILFADAPAEKLALAQAALRVDPGCMRIRAVAARVQHGAGQQAAAAASAAAALRCYRHTASTTTLPEFYALARELAAASPGAFTADDLQALGVAGDDRAQLERVLALFEAGRVEESEKALSDMAYELRDYATPLPLFRRHYQRLGWRWAQALCDLR
jgi:hypothetical protein